MSPLPPATGTQSLILQQTPRDSIRRVAGHFLVQSLPLWPAPTAALALAGSPMQANAEPTDAPDAEENVPTRMDNQHNKLDRTMPVHALAQRP